MLPFIKPNTTIYLDSGSTTTELAKIWPDQPNFIFTSSVDCILELSKLQHPTVFALGGELNKYSMSVCGMIIAIIGYFIIGPVMTVILSVLSAGVTVLVDHSLLPLVAIFVEPAKVLFLNNALNHGIFTPIGSAQAEAAGKSIMYMLEANPGPGLGVLLAYCFFAKDKMVLLELGMNILTCYQKSVRRWRMKTCWRR